MFSKEYYEYIYDCYQEFKIKKTNLEFEIKTNKKTIIKNIIWFFVFVILFFYNLKSYPYFGALSFIFAVYYIIDIGININKRFTLSDKLDNILNKIDDTSDYLLKYKSRYFNKSNGNSNQNSIKTNPTTLDNSFKLFKLEPNKTTSDEIKKTYRKLANIYHPDKWSSGTKSEQEAAERNFKLLNNAYEVLKKHFNVK